MSETTSQPEPANHAGRAIETSRSKPVRVMAGFLAGAGVVVSGAAFTAVVPRWLAGLLALLHAAVIIGYAKYTEREVTPNDAVASRKLPDGRFVAADAADQINGTIVEPPKSLRPADVPLPADPPVGEDPGYVPPFGQGGGEPK